MNCYLYHTDRVWTVTYTTHTVWTVTYTTQSVWTVTYTTQSLWNVTYTTQTEYELLPIRHRQSVWTVTSTTQTKCMNIYLYHTVWTVTYTTQTVFELLPIPYRQIVYELLPIPHRQSVWTATYTTQTYHFWPFISGQMQCSVDKTAMAMMEAIAEFSKQKRPQHLSMVRVVIFQASIAAIYHEQMQKATKPASSLSRMINSSFRLTGKPIIRENYFTFLFNKMCIWMSYFTIKYISHKN